MRKTTDKIKNRILGVACLLFCCFAMQAQTADYSRRMVESHGKAWSADKKWDYVSGLVTKSLLKCTTQ